MSIFKNVSIKQHSDIFPWLCCPVGQQHALPIANKLDAISATGLIPCGIDLSHFSEMCSLSFQNPSFVSSEEIISNLKTFVGGIHISFYYWWVRSSLLWILDNNRFCGYDSNKARFSVERIAFMLFFERRITAFVIEGIASFHQKF